MTDKEIKLKLPTPMKVKPSIMKYLDEFEDKGKTIWNFAGAAFVETLFYLHLVNKYKLYCYPGNKKAQSHERPIGLNVNLKLGYSKQEEEDFKEQFKNVSENIVNCVKKGEKVIMIPLGYKKGAGGHANILIYRVDARVIEHYEPHGGEFLENEKYQNASKRILTFFTNILNRELKANDLETTNYVEASQVCPYLKGFQTLEGQSTLPKNKIEPRGYCAAWSLFFMELNLKNPELMSTEILDNIYNYLSTKASGPDYLKKVIRGYAGYIVEHVNKYLAIFFKPTYNVSQILQKNSAHKEFIINKVFSVLIELEIMIALDPNFDLQKELKKTMKEYKKKTLGQTKEQQKQMRTRDPNLEKLYYRKRILQNYEEYKNLGTVSTPIIDMDSPESIEEAKVINPDILKQGLAHVERQKQIAEYKARPEVIEAEKRRKEMLQSRKKTVTPGAPKTRRIKTVLPEAFKKHIGDSEKTKLVEAVIKKYKINMATEEGRQKLLEILMAMGKK